MYGAVYFIVVGRLIQIECHYQCEFQIKKKKFKIQNQIQLLAMIFNS